MANKTIIFNGGAAGEFRTWRWPQRDGVYKYMPFRSVSHMEMHERLREKGSARCHYVRDGQEVWFSVVGFPKYAHLQLAEFETRAGLFLDERGAKGALDNLARFVQVIRRDPELTAWFRGLEIMDPARRGHEILRMAERIAGECKDPALIASFRLLANRTVFHAARVALRKAIGD